MRTRCSAAGITSASGHRLCRLVEVVRIDDERLGQLARRAGERAEHQHAALVVARGDELLGDQVHAVVQAADVAEVRCLEEAEHLGRLVVPARAG